MEPHVPCTPAQAGSTSMAHTGRVEPAADVLMPDKQKDPKMYLEGIVGGRKGRWLSRLLKTTRGVEPSRPL